MDDITKTKILKAIEAGQYGVSYTEPNCFVEHTKPSGEKYYIITGDDATFGCDYGSTTVTVCGYVYMGLCRVQVGGSRRGLGRG